MNCNILLSIEAGNKGLKPCLEIEYSNLVFGALSTTFEVTPGIPHYVYQSKVYIRCHLDDKGLDV